jgi:ketosteroid isomerase-like protein
MSEENVNAHERALEAINRRDVDAFLAEMDTEVEFHAVLQALLGGEGTVYRGHGGVRAWFRDMNEAFAEFHVDYSEIRDLGDRILASGRVRARGRESGAGIDAPIGALIEFRDGKVSKVLTYFDPTEALEAAGLPE